MKKICLLLSLLLALALPSLAQGEQERKLTLMVYLCGSDLESEYGSASRDLQEMLAARFDARAVTVLVMAGGTQRWNTPFDPELVSIAEIGEKGMRTVWREDARNMGEADTLETLLRFGAENYPARDYALILWNHGGGPLEGVCWDELFSMDSLTLQELTEGLARAQLPKKLSWIGFDACLMSSAEVAWALTPYARYMIASQETEPASGWDYAFLEGIGIDESGAETGRRIVDTYFESLAGSPDSLTLCCIDLAGMAGIQTAMDDFFAGVDEELSRESFSRLSGLRLSSTGFGKAARSVQENSFDLVDLGDLVRRYSEGEGEELLAALSRAVVYSRSSVPGASGLSVYHPFSNKKKYAEVWGDAYGQLGFSAGYGAYLRDFGALLTGEELADWAGLAAVDEGFGAGDENLYSLQLTQEQAQNFAEAQLLILAATGLESGIYGTQAADPQAQGAGDVLYSPVSVCAASLDENGVLSARYAGRTLYAVDAQGQPLLGPLSWQLSEDGETVYVQGLYTDESGREDSAASITALFSARAAGDALEIGTVQVFDDTTQSWTNRIPVREENYTNLTFYPDLRRLPAYDETLPGFDQWERESVYLIEDIRLPEAWGLRFFDTQLSAAQLYAVFQVTDTQQNTFCTPPVPVANPNLEDVAVAPRSVSQDDLEMKLYVTRDASPLDPGLNVVVEMTNRSRWRARYIFQQVVLNGVQQVVNARDTITPLNIQELAPGETRTAAMHVAVSALTSLAQADALRFQLWVAYPEHANGSYQKTYAFDLSNCPLTGIAPAAPRPLAETRQGDITWQLCQLSRNQHGDLTGVVAIVNDSEEEIDGEMASVLLNGVSTGGTLYLVSLPHTRIYLPFTAQDSTRLASSLHIEGARNSYYWLGETDLLSRYGAGVVRELRLLMSYGYDITRTVSLPLVEPWTFSEKAAAAPAGRKLLEGDVSAAVERVLLADDGVGLRLAFYNDTDRDVHIRMEGFTLNGRPAANRYPLPVMVGARGVTAVCIAVEGEGVLRPGEKISSCALRFTTDAFSTEPAALDMQLPESGERYLPDSCWRVRPARYGPPEGIFVKSYDASSDTWRAALKARASQEGLALAFAVSNEGGETAEYRLSGLKLNGWRAVRGAWTVEAAAGETGGIEALLSWEELRGLTRLTEVSCALETGGARRQISFSLEGGDLAGLMPGALAPLAVAQTGDIHWRLLGVEPEEAGGLALTLEAENAGDTALEDYAYIALDGLIAIRSQRFAVPAGERALLRFTSPDQLIVHAHEVEVYNYEALTYPLMTDLLASHGIGAVSTVRLMAGYALEEQKRIFPIDALFQLPEPVTLPGLEGAEPLPSLAMNDSDIAIRLYTVLIGDDGAALAVDLVNDHDDTFTLSIDELNINGLPAALNGYNTYTLPAHTTTCVALSARADPSLGPGDNIEGITLTSTITLQRGSQPSLSEEWGMTFKVPAPLGVEGGVQLW